MNRYAYLGERSYKFCKINLAVKGLNVPGKRATNITI